MEIQIYGLWSDSRFGIEEIKAFSDDLIFVRGRNSYIRGRLFIVVSTGTADKRNVHTGSKVAQKDH